MKKIYKVMLALVTGMVFTSANAAMVLWQPSNADVNYIYTLDTGYALALFDVEDFDGPQLHPLLLNTGVGFDSIKVEASGVDFNAISLVTANTVTFFNDSQFVLALTPNGSDWFEPISWFETAAGSNIYNVGFSQTYVTSIDAIPAVVPVPAAAWLFATGVLALFGIARQKVYL